MTFTEFAYELSHASAYLAAMAAGLVGYGFVRLSLKGEGLIGHLATGLLLMHMAVLMRTLYWDVARNLIASPHWERWMEITGGTAVNTIFNIMVILAGYHSLKALKLAIPENVRREYSLVEAAFYPKRGLGHGLRNMLQGWASRNKR